MIPPVSASRRAASDAALADKARKRPRKIRKGGKSATGRSPRLEVGVGAEDGVKRENRGGNLISCRWIYRPTIRPEYPMCPLAIGCSKKQPGSGPTAGGGKKLRESLFLADLSFLPSLGRAVLSRSLAGSSRGLRGVHSSRSLVSFLIRFAGRFIRCRSFQGHKSLA